MQAVERTTRCTTARRGKAGGRVRSRLADLPLVVLCGGRGIRIQADMPHVPKPLVEVGDRPILWHVLQMYAHAGVSRFILCLGYKGEQIEAVFAGDRGSGNRHGRPSWIDSSWRIQCQPTGLDTNTGGRLKQVDRLITSDLFLATYTDGLADIDLEAVLAFHLRHGRIATLTCVHPLSTFGFVQLNPSGLVETFHEKPRLQQWVNGGFFVFDRRIFGYLRDNDVLESDTFGRLVADRQLMAYSHHGFWTCMDTYKDHVMLNQLWREGTRPWARWLASSKEAR